MKFVTLKSLACFTTAFIAVAGSVKGNVSPLDARQESIVTIAAFTANGDLSRLSQALQEGLDAKLTTAEIKEVIVQMYAYAGFPRSLNALHTFMEVLKDRRERGINDAEGRNAGPYPPGKSNHEFGTDNQTRLVGRPVKGEVYDFAPAIDQFLKQHLFGDIFGRDVLDWKTREIATIAALSSLGGTDSQLRSHFNVGMNNGLSADQLDRIVAIIKTKVGDVEGYNAAKILDGVLKRTDRSNSSASSNFTGSVFVKMIVSQDSIFNTQMAAVTFEPGARTNWHYHPSGQILIITEGTAFYQEQGMPKQVVSKGQVVKCPPNVRHWHGATPHGSMTHMALSPNLEKGGVVWLQKVTDEEYQKSTR